METLRSDGAGLVGVEEESADCAIDGTSLWRHVYTCKGRVDATRVVEGSPG